VSPLERIRTAWSFEPPDWIAALAEACERDSQAAVGRRIGYSASVVNQLLAGSYRGNMAKVERAVRLALLPEQVCCPVLGPITSTDCVRHQRHPSVVNSVKAELARTCPRCEYREDPPK